MIEKNDQPNHLAVVVDDNLLFILCTNSNVWIKTQQKI